MATAILSTATYTFGAAEFGITLAKSKALKVIRVHRESRDHKETPARKVHRETPVHKESQVPKVRKAHRGYKVHRETLVPKALLVHRAKR